jgi:hypothetical protein
MASMFRSSNLSNANLSSWDVSNVENMNRMFYKSELISDLSSWDV